ncbi:ISAs1 family transposase [Limnoraphis robusta CCNP1324]|uniref:ISAs1 family transposase n=1 Tax=Limnoraphis robusta TaxID=1118279 RepID=UPI002B1F9938|nr:ISAs1 family transposase [Limnoraphis robusta]MEA5544552.1 ISAs1 family transposase [Limnoraphis robusta CCNP1324]
MSDKLQTSLEKCFGELADPRVEGRCDHKLLDMIIIAVCAVICGADSWVGIETFAKAKESWLRTFLDLKNGIPAHDTFGYVFSRIDGEAFQACFMNWVEAVFRVTDGQVIAIDGKTMRGSHDKMSGKNAIHMVSAWATANGIVMGQRKVDDKSNEIRAIPELLKLLDVSGCIVTIDAMGCQKDIAQTIRDRKADYILRVKDNQSHLKQDIEDWFVYGDKQHYAGMQMSYHQTTHKTNGRVEIRRCWVITDPIAFEYIRHYEGWADLNSIIRVQRERRDGGKITHETAYYISSLITNASQIVDATRHHWAIENSFHWVLDVTFNEDASRIRVGDSAENMGVLRTLALNILKRDPSKSSLKQKRFRAALDNAFLLKLLSQF